MSCAQSLAQLRMTAFVLRTFLLVRFGGFRPSFFSSSASRQRHRRTCSSRIFRSSSSFCSSPSCWSSSGSTYISSRICSNTDFDMIGPLREANFGATPRVDNWEGTPGGARPTFRYARNITTLSTQLTTTVRAHSLYLNVAQ